MQPAPSPVFYEPPLAAKPQLREKPHQGLPSKNPTWNQGPNVCNFTVTLGLRATVVENGVGQTYSARYYNPATGRFMSRDPEAGNRFDPASLHNYLYADGDPVNRIDPSGRDAILTFLFTTADISMPAEVVLASAGAKVAMCFTGIALLLEGLASSSLIGGLGGGALAWLACL
jgi:RHS repeat-associated protein